MLLADRKVFAIEASPLIQLWELQWESRSRSREWPPASKLIHREIFVMNEQKPLAARKSCRARSLGRAVPTPIQQRGQR